MKSIPIRSIQHAAETHDFSEGFRIRSIRELLGGRDMIQELHRNDFFFLLALKKGRGSHEIDFIPYQVSNCTVFLMRPGQVHRLTLKAGSEGFLVELKNGFFYPGERTSSQLLRTAAGKNLCQLSPVAFSKLHDVLSYVYNEYKNRQDGFQDVIKANLKIFFIELMRHRQSKEKLSAGSGQYSHDRLQEFFEIVEANVRSQKRVSYYAEALNLSQFQLNSITRTLLGKSASALIDDYIILESKRHLLATSSQVSQIGYLLGYEDVSYFIRFFRKRTGYTPETFRKKFG
jgi:AraC family transcriptional regulator, transcriptional activator of pobA